jgi:signal transduction histidine kinase
LPAPAAALGWCVAATLAAIALSLRRRLELVARADHELRGPLAALTLLGERMRRREDGAELAAVLDAQLERARAGLADLHAARSGERSRACRDLLSLERQVRTAAAGWEPVAHRSGRTLRLDWRAGEARVAADPGRLSQALGNLLSNALEHGAGQVEVRGRRVGRTVRLEVADAGGLGRPSRRRLPRPIALTRHHGRGLTIAARAAREAGGTLELSNDGHGTVAAIELPAEDG